MGKRLATVIGLSIWMITAWAGPKPDLRADANSAADMQAEQRQRVDELQRFKTIDTNGDGFISEVEARENRRLLNAWKKADLNSDGKIDQSEFSVFETDEAASAPGGR